jgi:hypothetical protein
MPNVTQLVADDTAKAIGDIIALKPTSIVVNRSGSSLAAQTVRLETLSSQMQIPGPGGVTHRIDALLLGYKNHPTVTNTNIQTGDRFAASGVNYEVVIVMPGHVDCLQAYMQVRA